MYLLKAELLWLSKTLLPRMSSFHTYQPLLFTTLTSDNFYLRSVEVGSDWDDDVAFIKENPCVAEAMALSYYPSTTISGIPSNGDEDILFPAAVNVTLPPHPVAYTVISTLKSITGTIPKIHVCHVVKALKDTIRRNVETRRLFPPTHRSSRLFRRSHVQP
ncbi:hypothetical protein BD410DRAFT_352499 [Rickenella mellea]|uniref:Uncharacterized protein n=1 Tax=Rickenella mellea TaxID=50990 RepID=A0A4Y7QME6_9AGAM|nr:hypothetical protein BD410DRAFT_352499 [Rickenella mellea]